jgi:hypothetical protein
MLVRSFGEVEVHQRIVLADMSQLEGPHSMELDILVIRVPLHWDGARRQVDIRHGGLPFGGGF